jgi:acetoin utilization protein AcuB
MQVHEFMKPVVMTILPTHSCYEAAVRMRRSEIHHLAVVDDRGQLLGIITDRDLRSFLFAALVNTPADRALYADKALDERPVRDVMSAPAITVGPEEPLAAAVRLMAEKKIGSVPVVEHNQLVGIITESDLIRLLFRRRIFCCAEVESVLLPVA